MSQTRPGHARRAMSGLAVALVALLALGGAASAQEPDALARIQAAGRIRINTDPNYAPQSFQQPDGSFDGFDVAVAEEIAARLGVEVEFTTFNFDLVTAGGWNDRWDMSVGSVTVTAPRKAVLEFTRPYYYTPAQMAVTTASGISDPAALAGQPICVGSGTTYLDWLSGTLELVDAPEPATPPQGATAYVLDTDQLCAQAIASGRTDFAAWLSSSTTVAAAIAAGTPVVALGEPVFYESLAVAFDITVADDDGLVAAVDAIVAELHADGTLSRLSQEWFDGLDLTVAQ